VIDIDAADVSLHHLCTHMTVIDRWRWRQLDRMGNNTDRYSSLADYSPQHHAANRENAADACERKLNSLIPQVSRMDPPAAQSQKYSGDR
jgi:hypothetical protein